MKFLPASILLALVATDAMAQQAPYLDDRSNAANLVKSLYNAVSRKEYSRAWDYFGETKPSKTFDAFVEGYATTDRVAVATGAVSEEGAAGSVYYQVPVAIQAFDTNGKDAVFAGCYTARLANPQIQGSPFAPMHLEKGSLKPAEGPLSNALPEKCGDAPAPDPKPAVLDKVIAEFTASYGDNCGSLQPDAEAGAADPEIHEIKFKYTFDNESTPESSVTLFRFACTMAAYNSVEVYYLATSDEVTQLQFAEPDLDIVYKDPDERTQLESMTIIGFHSADQILNSSYDEQDHTITSFAKWRGVGDISSGGKYLFRNGKFVLVHFEVDPTEDGEINPETVLDYDTPP